MSRSPTLFTRSKMFRTMFWQPPRRSWSGIQDRTVSFLELFYDLVYVVVIARASHTPAEHLSWRGVMEFSIVFGMIWIAWLDGTVYQDLHGRDDGPRKTAGGFLFVALTSGLSGLRQK